MTTKQARYACAAVLLFALAGAGCESKTKLGQQDGHSAATASPMNVEANLPGPSGGSTSVPALFPDGTSGAGSLATNAPHVENNTQSLGNDPHANAGAKNGSQKAATAGDQRDVENYTSEKPLLVGLSLADTRQKVIAQYGNPLSEFDMNDDDTDPIHVLDYGGFTVGFGKNGKLRYIDVSSTDVNPGLNGVKLGQTGDDAIRTLGNPDIKTNYVMAYTTKTTMLKLDIDPKTKKIQSIKLFPASEHS